MNSLIKLISIPFVLSFSAPAFSEEIQVWGRSYDYACGYFSRRAADISVTLKDSDLPFGTKVNLIVGWGGEQTLNASNRQLIQWTDRSVITAFAIDDSTWEARIQDKTLHNRSENRVLTVAQFAFEILVPGESARYLNGGSTWGYYETESLNARTLCVPNGQLPEWRQLEFRVVQK